MDAKITALESNITRLRKELYIFTSTPLDTRLSSQTDDLQKSKLLTELSYSIHTLFFSTHTSILLISVLFKLNGEQTTSVLDEIERLKSTFKNLTAAKEKLKPTLKIDAEAAGRFIASALLEVKENETDKVKENDVKIVGSLKRKKKNKKKSKPADAIIQ